MKNKEQLSHPEIMGMLAFAARELMEAEIYDKNMPNKINRAKALGQVVTAHHREEIMENRRRSGIIGLKDAEAPTLKKLPPKNKKGA